MVSQVTFTGGNIVTGAGTGTTGSTKIVAQTSPTLTTPILGAASATSIDFTSTAEIIGTTTNDNADAGSVGEVISAVLARGTTTPLTTVTPINVASISLTAGDWDVSGSVGFNGVAATMVTSYAGSIGPTSATINTLAYYRTKRAFPSASGNNDNSFAVPSQRISLSGTTTIYLVATATFTADALYVYGQILARRAR